MAAEGEHFFLDADTKLHKMSPEGWREGAKGHMPPVTFTLYLRVKFYPDSLADFRYVVGLVQPVRWLWGQPWWPFYCCVEANASDDIFMQAAFPPVPPHRHSLFGDG